MSGREELMLECLATGMHGFVGSQFNVLGDLYNELKSAFDNGDMEKARGLQLLGASFIAMWQTSVDSGINGFKNILNVIESGVPVGDARLPSVPITPEARKNLLASLSAWCKTEGFHGWPAKAKVCRSLS
mmetsp:Transcript_17922/g.33995  ORF Transcript_17922/g.33995 Transcript_17922/m.33995 type:complete len:130 (-) Transcript_17922:194-583(-)